jgi:hypothetical protein
VELSAVAVPGNPNALSRSLQLEVDRRQLRRAAGFPIEYNANLDLTAECKGATDDQLTAMAAVTLDDRQGKRCNLFIHHHRDGRVNAKALADCLRELSRDDCGLTPEQRDFTYMHLVDHYQTPGIKPPGPREPVKGI